MIMSRKSVQMRFAPLQRVVAEVITDPAEQARLDEIHKREKRKQHRRPSANGGAKRARSAVKKKMT
jgi:hypothetical protein